MEYHNNTFIQILSERNGSKNKLQAIKTNHVA